MINRALGLLTATELTQMLRERTIGSRELLAHYGERRAAHNEALNAIVTVDDEAAHAAAVEADERLASGQPTPPLLGLPMTIKDALATKGMRSTGGAVALADHVPDQDAEVVARSRTAGAVIFGKTNLPEWSADVQSYNEVFGGRCDCPPISQACAVTSRVSASFRSSATSLTRRIKPVSPT